MIHHLKTWPEPFAALRSGEKTHEVRDTTDRNFVVGDVLELHEFDPATNAFSGLYESRAVTHITPGGSFGLPPNLCVMSLSDPSKETA